MTLRHVCMVGLGIVGMSLVACSQPAPIVVHETRTDSVWLTFDPEAGNGHNHPYAVSSERLAQVLRGVWVKPRDVVGGFGLLADGQGSPAFSVSDVARLARYLAQALAKASPRDMATFYLVTGDPSHGKLITSGGLFVKDDWLFVILANARTSPSSVQYENTYEFEARDQPLIPIARYKFTVGFSPAAAWIPNSQARHAEGYERYLDESKLIVVDLSRLPAEPPSAPAPSLQSPAISR
ncbi:MAG: hypothetical protein ACT4OO_14975 [Nitrospiraceae bacterium]